MPSRAFSVLARALCGRRARRALAGARADLAALPIEEAVARRTSGPLATHRGGSRLRLFDSALTALLAREQDSHPCLPRSLALLGEARRLGYLARLAIGVRRGPAGVESHAWLVLDGEPFLEPHERADSFETVTVLPR